LLYDYLPGGSLDHNLHGKRKFSNFSCGW
jgi:hypothetical protein